MPDLRNEFLRGYHGEAADQLSGDIGKHQEATNHLHFDCYNSGSKKLIQSRASAGQVVHQSNMDSTTFDTEWRNYAILSSGTDAGDVSTYTSRPTNVAVLYCIKYE